ncbi:MAG: carbohydrate kinase family protein [Promethearchaeota archaeon]
MVRVITCGAINSDIKLFVKRFPRAGEEIPIKEIGRVPGGKAANVAVAAARVSDPKTVAIFGGVGKDEIGKEQINILEEEGIITNGIKIVDGVESGQAYIVIDESGQNVIHTYFGANNKLKPQDLMVPERLALIKEAKTIAISDPPLEIAEMLAKLGNEYKADVLWDPGTKIIEGLPVLSKYLSFVDFLLLNEVEAEMLTGYLNLTEATAAISKFNKNLKIIFKQGKNGCVYTYNQEMLKIPGINLQKMGLKVISTVGSGDAFFGVFAAFLSMGLSEKDSLIYANAAGALNATRKETRGSPTKLKLQTFLNSLD